MPGTSKQSLSDGYKVIPSILVVGAICNIRMMDL